LHDKVQFSVTSRPEHIPRATSCSASSKLAHVLLLIVHHLGITSVD